MADRRDELARELAATLIKMAPIEARIKEIKDELKEIAETAGENLRITVDGKGIVKVSRPAEAKFQGIFPQVAVKVFLALDDKERDRLTKGGIIVMAPTYGAPYYGRVEFEPFKAVATRAA